MVIGWDIEREIKYILLKGIQPTEQGSFYMSKYIDNPVAVNTIASILTQPFNPGMGDTTPCKMEKEFYNGLSEPVTIMGREGVPVEIAPMRIEYKDSFIIRFVFTYHKSVKINTERLSNAKCETSIALRDAIRHGSVKEGHFGKMVATITYVVTKEQLHNGGGSLYLTNLDIVVSTMQGNYVPRHPQNLDGIRNTLVGDEETINTVGSFGYAIQIVDNENVYGKRYININKEIYEVNPITDFGRVSGVYHAKTAPVGANGMVPPPIAILYTFEEAETYLGFYKTIEEAKLLGDIGEEKKRELEERALMLRKEVMDFNLRKVEAEKILDKQKREYELSRIAEDEARKTRENEYKRLETEQTMRLARLKEEVAALDHQRSMDSLHRKDHYEERSYGRKDSSDMLKWIPGLIGAGAALFLALR